MRTITEATEAEIRAAVEEARRPLVTRIEALERQAALQAHLLRECLDQLRAAAR